MKPDKEWIVNYISQITKDNEALFVTSYSGLSASQMDELRSQLRGVSGGYVVTKVRIMDRLIKDRYKDFNFDLSGSQSGIAYGEDGVGIAKVLKKFSDGNEALKLKIGLFGDKLLELSDIKALADLPSREVLIAKLLGSLQSPIYGFVYVLKAQLTSLMTVLSGVLDVKKKEEEQAKIEEPKKAEEQSKVEEPKKEEEQK